MSFLSKGDRKRRIDGRKREHAVPAFERFEDRLLLATFLVTDPADTDTAGTLRFALNQLAGSNDPTNELDFAIGTNGTRATIVLTADLPAIVKPVSILGDTQGGTPNTSAAATNATIVVQVDLNGHAGLNFAPTATGSVARGLAIYGGTGPAISIGANNVVVAGNFLGVKADGTTAAPNSSGVGVGPAATGATIGSAAAADRNLIAGNAGPGVILAGTGSAVRGNLIGTDRTGLAAVPNQSGVSIGGSGNAVGGTNPGEANVIAFNTGAAVLVDTGTGDAIRQNSIFANGSGIVLANNGNSGQPAPVITAVTSVAGTTMISGQVGILTAGANTLEFFASASGDPATPGQAHVFLGSFTQVFAAGNQPFTASLAAVVPAGRTITATVTSAAGNTSPLATAAPLTNPFLVTTASDSGIGSLRQAILNANASPGSDTIVFGLSGAFVITPASPLPAATGQLVIDGTTQAGYAGAPIVQLSGASAGAGADGLALGAGSAGSTIKGLDIYGFAGAGVHLASANNFVQNNYLGTDVAGTGAGTGNQVGVLIDNATGNLVGGLSNVGNLISGNAVGVLIQGGSSQGNSIQGNLIGTAVSGNVGLPNSSDGVRIVGASNNTIGPGNSGSGNVIAFNLGNAVLVDTGTGDAIRQNSIFANGSGIALINGGNSGQPPPVIGSVNSTAGSTTISAQLSGSAPNSAYVIEFFAGAAGDPASPGQAHVLLGSQTVNTDGSGSAPINATFAVAVAAGRSVTATATSAAGNTSTLAAPFTLANPFLVTTTGDSGVGSLRQAVLNANANPGLDTITFALPGPFLITLGSTITVTEMVVIDGTSQAGYSGTPVVLLDGGSAAIDGLTLAAGSSGSTVKGLGIRRFGGAGVRAVSDNDTVSANVIGGAAGQGNGQGVLVTGSGSTVGGTGAGAGNLIAFNSGAGVTVSGGANDAIRQNSIFANGSGIDLVNGGNGGQAAPTNLAATSSAGTTTVNGQVSVTSPGSYTLEFFASAAGDPATPGQAHVFLGSSPLPGLVAGNNAFAATIIATVPVGQRITATITSASGNTSPLATDVVAVNPFLVTTTGDSGVGSLRQAVLNANANPGLDTIAFNLPGPSVIALGSTITVTDPVVIDGTSQVGYAFGNPPVVLDGGNAAIDGLTLAAGSSGSTVKGLGIRRFGKAGLSVASDNDTVAANVIGGAAGQGNGQGVLVTGSGATIGGVVPGLPNTIFFNTGAGVTVSGGANDAIRQNSIFANGSGIALINGGNAGLASPAIAGVTSIQSGTIIDVQFVAPVDGTYVFEFFASAAGDPGTDGQAHTYLGSVSLPLLAGSRKFTATVAGITPVGQRVTATATSPVNNTSALAAQGSVVDPFTVISTADAGVGTLRQAILNANASPGLNTITFALPAAPYIITLSSSLTITDSIVIDGKSQAGLPAGSLLQLNGNGTTGSGLVLDLGSDNSTIRGLDVYGFTAGAGIEVRSSRNRIQGNDLGTGPTGTAPGPVGQAVGVLVSGSGNLIGGVGAGEPNVIGFQANNGISILSGVGNLIFRNRYLGVAGFQDSASSDIVLGPLGNNGQPDPGLLAASIPSNGNLVSTRVHFDSAPSTALTIDFYLDASPTSRVYLASAAFPAGAIDADLGFTVPTGFSVVPGTRLVATATEDLGNGTSAFSSVVTVAAPTVVTTTNDNGTGSLRQAIINANGSPGPGLVPITFDLGSESNPSGPFTIVLTTALPEINRGVLIDGTTQFGYVAETGTPIVELTLATDSTSTIAAAAGVDGLRLARGSDGSTIRGLDIYGFIGGAGIRVLSGGNTIAANVIGLSSSGQSAKPNLIGIELTNASNNTLGAQTIPVNLGRTQSRANGRNLISGNGNGIQIDGGAANTILNAFIGASRFDLANPEDTTRNSGDGILINNSNGNRVGAAPTDAIHPVDDETLNVISGNGANGVHIKGASTGNQVIHSFIGTDPTGQFTADKIRNNQNGVFLDDASLNTIGSANPGWGNVIAGNDSAGIALLAGGQNTIIGNQIGTNVAMVQANGGDTERVFTIPNRSQGIYVISSPGNAIGQPIPGGGNRIAGNLANGVLIEGAASRGNTVAANLIGAVITPNRNSTVGNNLDGIQLHDSATSVIGGGAVGDPTSNIVAGNLGQGIEVFYQDANATGGNRILGNLVVRNRQDGILLDSGIARWFSLNDQVIGNLVGTNPAGTSTFVGAIPQGNALNGIHLQGVSAIVETNVSSGNGLSGVAVDAGALTLADDYGPAGTTIRIVGNKLGTNLAGSSAFDSVVSRSIGNILDGVLIDHVLGVQVGDGTASGANVISGNLGRGVELRNLISPPRPDSRAVEITSNRIGTDASGDAPVDIAGKNLGNLSDGIFLLNASASISSNVISNNRGYGIHAATLPNAPATGALSILENEIGTNHDGSQISFAQANVAYLLGNGSAGIFLDSLGSGRVAGNTISGNQADGLQLLNATGVVIQSNRIGTDAKGRLALPNAGSGVFLNRSGGNQIGGAGLGNVLSGNQFSGVLISGPFATPSGVVLGNAIQGNLVGMSADGLGVVPNDVAGVIVTGSSRNTIGGTAPGEGNLISGNRLYGVLIAASKGAGSDAADSLLVDGVASFNVVQGNKIGTDITGNSVAGLQRVGNGSGVQQIVPTGNTSDGVFLLNTDQNTIGGADNARNIIAGNAANGIRIFGALSTANVVDGNYIGVGDDGETSLGNQANGVTLDNAGPHNRVGAAAISSTSVLATGNVISGNNQSGVLLISSVGDGGNIINANRIGTNAAGTGPVGNRGDGVFVFSSSNNLISGNLISGNDQSGVLLFSSTPTIQSRANYLAANRIGTDLNGRVSLGNGGDGVQVINSVGNFIGTNATGYRNIISGNAANGIEIDSFADADASGNSVAGNYIGTNLDGDRPIGNLQNGVLVINAKGNLIGVPGTDLSTASYPLTLVPVAPSNVISANGLYGVHLTGTAQNDLMQSNYLGVTARGQLIPDTLTYKASSIDIFVDDTGLTPSTHTIGGTSPGSGNLIAGDGNTVGIELFGPVTVGVDAGNRIQGNLIGLGVNAPANGFIPETTLGGGAGVGVLVLNSSGNLIGLGQVQSGGATLGSNVISGNAAAGVQITGASSRNVVRGNFIGTGIAGTADYLSVTAQNIGVQIIGSTGNIIGGFSPAEANVISGNLTGVDLVTAGSNIVLGNRIGTTPSGLAAAPNLQFGVVVDNSPSVMVAYNLISANGIAGVELVNSASAGVIVQNNLVGTDVNGRSAFPSSRLPMLGTVNGTVALGAQKNGVALVGASLNTIGSNTIAGNYEVGVYIAQVDFAKNKYAVPLGNQVRGNAIRDTGIYGILLFDAPNNQAAPFTGKGVNNTFLRNYRNFLNYVTSVNKGGTIPLKSLTTTPSRAAVPASQVQAKAVPRGPASQVSRPRR